METQADKGERFAALHEGEPFVIPNPWDAGSAKVLAGLGFRALATTSSGFAYTLGRADGGATLDDVGAHALADATPLPVSVDLENGYGDPAAAIAHIAEAGAVGGSIEDYDRDVGIVPFDVAVERVAAAVATARSLPFRFVLTARAENMLHGVSDLDDTIGRLRAFGDAGADVLYAPGLKTLDEIQTVCSAVSKPVNVLARPGMRFEQLVRAGAQRVSVGGALAWVAADALIAAATAIRDDGDFAVLGVAHSPREWLS
jgi:2-methylisocitrate lyase-like PEP mutase family enzyme